MKARHLFLLAMWLAAAPVAGKTPQWLSELAAAPQPAQKAEVDAVKLLSDIDVEVRAGGKMRKHVRVAFRILRPAGEGRAILGVTYDSRTRVKEMHAWTIPATGKESEAGLRDAADTVLNGIQGAEMISDVRTRLLRAPGVLRGAVVGFEYVVDADLLAAADFFDLLDTVPVLEARYTLHLPAGWVVTPTWVNHAPVEAARSDERSWQWTLRDLPAVVQEPFMPSWRGVAGQLQVAFAPPGATPELSSWQGIGSWYAGLARERGEVSPAMRAKVAELTRGADSDLARLRALAAFVQADIRYVAIELGIGGYQPHAAASVFDNRFGDCKDKVTLLGAMLAEAGISSIPVLVNVDRSVVGPHTQPGLMFNHVILAVRLAADVPRTGLLSVSDRPQDGTLLFFDPTDEVTPLGRLRGALQGSYALEVAGGGGELVQLPRIAHVDSGVQRTAELALSANGTLSGTFVEHLTGDLASQERFYLRGVRRDADVIKPVEARLAQSIAAFRIASAQPSNGTALDQPFEWRYSVVAESYARRAGDLLTVRPRVVGTKMQVLPDSDTPRVHDMTFSEARTDHDEISIALPAGYVVDSLPDPVDVDVGFANYHSRTEVQGALLKYTRSFELREQRIPASQADDYRRLQQAVARDERAVAVLKSNTAK